MCLTPGRAFDLKLLTPQPTSCDPCTLAGCGSCSQLSSYISVQSRSCRSEVSDVGAILEHNLCQRERERETTRRRTRVPGQRVAPSSSTLAKERECEREREGAREGGMTTCPVHPLKQQARSDCALDASFGVYPF